MKKNLIKDDKKFLQNKKLNLTDYQRRQKLYKFLSNFNVSDVELINNLNMFMDRRSLSRLLNFYELFKLQKNISGNIALFGVYYGKDLINLLHLMQIIEPYNFSKKIYGFDTFKGIKGSNLKNDILNNDGGYKTKKNTYEFLKKLCHLQESYSTIQTNIIEIIKGDVRKTLKSFLKKNDHIFFSLLYFDLDIYKPTYETLLRLEKHMNKGCVLVFDQFNSDIWPGETKAIKDFFKKIKKKYQIKSGKFKKQCSYFIYN